MNIREKRHREAQAGLDRMLAKREKILTDLARVHGTINELRKTIKRYDRLNQAETPETRAKATVDRILTKGMDHVFPGLFKEPG